MNKDTTNTNLENNINLPQSECSISISQNAIERITKIQQQNSNLILRLKIESGGCSGLQTIFDFEELTQDYDAELDHLLISNNRKYALVDRISADIIKGSQIDFITKFGGSFFALTNLNSSDQCSCGISFSLD